MSTEPTLDEQIAFVDQLLGPQGNLEWTAPAYTKLDAILASLNRLRALPRERAVGELDADQKRLCELMDICRPHVDIGLEVRAELRRALIRLYRIAALSQKEPL